MYKILERYQSEIVINKSRFISVMMPISTDSEVKDILKNLNKEFPKATHYCYAYRVCGKEKSSDDGEPSGTAGRPMLDVLLKEGITNVAVVVTRYFGGVLLGTGGLVRAYQKSVQEGLANSEIIEKRNGFLLYINTDYNGIGKLQYLFAQKEISILESEYGVDVRMTVLVPMERKEEIEKAVIEHTNGTAGLEWGDETIYAVINKQVQLFP